MPRYFFHTTDGTRDRDTDGTDCVHDGAARQHAIMYIGALMNSEPQVLSTGCDFRVEVTDQFGRLLFTVIALAVDAPPSTIAG